MFYEKGVLRNFTKFTGKHLCHMCFFVWFESFFAIAFFLITGLPSSAVEIVSKYELKSLHKLILLEKRLLKFLSILVCRYYLYIKKEITFPCQLFFLSFNWNCLLLLATVNVSLYQCVSIKWGKNPLFQYILWQLLINWFYRVKKHLPIKFAAPHIFIMKRGVFL